MFTSDLIEKLPNLGIIFSQLRGVDKNGYVISNAGTNNPKILVLVDGIEGSTVDHVSPRDVESIEFLKNPAYTGIYGIRGSGGVLLITTKKGNYVKSDNSAAAKNTLIFNLPLQSKKEFYVPKFDPLSEKSENADNRRTVYWNPEIITDKNGQKKISINSPQLRGIYRLVIEGLGSKGEMCHAFFDYEITASN